MNIKLTPEQQKRADALSKMILAEWDAVCKRCGICCLEKFEFPMTDAPKTDDDIKIIYMKHCCDKFDTKTCRCTIYQTRHSNKDCEKLDMNLILNTRTLPSSCGYVEYIFGPAPFPAKVDFSEVTPITDNYEKSLDELAKHIIKNSFLWSERRR